MEKYQKGAYPVSIPYGEGNRNETDSERDLPCCYKYQSPMGKVIEEKVSMPLQEFLLYQSPMGKVIDRNNHRNTSGFVDSINPLWGR